MSNERETPFSSAPPARLFDRSAVPPGDVDELGAPSSIEVQHGSSTPPEGGEGISGYPGADGEGISVFPEGERGSGFPGDGERGSGFPGDGERGSAPPTGDPQRATMPAMEPSYAALLPRPGNVAVVAPGPTVVSFGSGRSLAVTEQGGEERVEIRAAGGALLLSVRLTDEGPVFSLSGASFEIAAAKTLSLSAETLRVSALKDITIEAGGGLTERIAGDSTREVGGRDRVSARDVEVAAHPGGISLRANDDVDVVGERVRLNSDDPPMPVSWEEHRARHALPAKPASEEQLQQQAGDGEKDGGA